MRGLFCYPSEQYVPPKYLIYTNPSGDYVNKMSYISAVTKDNRVYVWERTPNGERILQDYPAPYYFYHDDENGEYETIFKTPVSKVEFDTRTEYYNAKKEFEARRIKTWESDIPPELRVLSNRYYGKPSPKLNITLLDIEVDYDPELGVTVQEMVATNPYAPINSVALCHEWKKQVVVLCVPPEESSWTSDTLREAVESCVPDAPIDKDLVVEYVVCHDERDLLINLIAEIEDSDVLSGWNSDFFDIPYIAQRIARVLDGQAITLDTVEAINEQTGKIKLTYTENPNPSIAKKGAFRWLKRLDFPVHGVPSFRPVASDTNGKLMGNTLDLVGRIRVDYMNLVKKYEPGERPSYKLEAVSEEVLIDDKTKQPTLPKLKYEGTLRDLYRTNFPFFVRYNIRDTEILYGFERKLGYIDVANVNFHLSTGLMSHVTGTLKLAELALVNYCHHVLKRVVKNVTNPEIDRSIDGALVLLPQIGLHEYVGSIDINSLYPSAIRSLNISIETLRGQFTRNATDFEQIVQGTPQLCTLVLEDKTEHTMTAYEWREYLQKKAWAISGYGTVFDQTEQGFIPALLAEWYSLRKQYQAKKAEAADKGQYDLVGYYDRLQYVYKIKLNSLYGALTNLYFRFYDLRMGESTTGSGRVILKHQCRTVSDTLGDGYDVEFPLYSTYADAIEGGYDEEEARRVSLDGTTFNGAHQSKAVIYGDTDSTYFNTYTDNIDDAIKVADRVAEVVNASYPEFMRKTFLCSPGYDNIIKAGREIVSDRGIFVDKKRYILHLVDLDGKRVDKMKVMGLDTKKTTLPSYVAKQLNHFIERFLKGESWEDISVAVVEFKDTLANTTDITSIGLPKGVNNLEEYETAYAQDHKCRLPGHVAAALLYNQSLQQYGDKFNPPITSGTKIKVFYLLQPQGRFKSIALPTDMEIAPKWFTENIHVDINAHIKRLVDNPLGNILKAIDKKPPSKQSLLVDSLLVF